MVCVLSIESTTWLSLKFSYFQKKKNPIHFRRMVFHRIPKPGVNEIPFQSSRSSTKKTGERVDIHPNFLLFCALIWVSMISVFCNRLEILKKTSQNPSLQSAYLHHLSPVPQKHPVRKVRWLRKERRRHKRKFRVISFRCFGKCVRRRTPDINWKENIPHIIMYFHLQVITLQKIQIL